ncbi:4-diphosphocytidyl-2C-methyl-D-erythritol kinase [Alicyclobacillaceae bacterium I2511]|nr:4-diphosphocytidyl-2C-methyl-D-erythritol kinase [Alicyclobacillaceae bacterium I2511]
MNKPTTQGGYANSSGSTLERTVIHTLEDKGFVGVPYGTYRKAPEQYGTEILLRNVPYTTIYGHQGKTEFLLQSEEYGLQIRIECKWQQSSGSVDEKFPYLYLNCVETMPEQTIFILVDGGGAKQGAVDWLRRAASQRMYLAPESEKQIRVLSLGEFIGWANKTFR